MRGRPVHRGGAIAKSSAWRDGPSCTAYAYLRDLIRVMPYWPRDRYLDLSPLRWSATRAALDPDALAAENGPSPSRRPRESKRRRVCPCTRIMRSAALPRKDAPSCTGYRKRAPDLTEPERKKGEGSLLGLPSPIVYCRLSSLQKATSSTFRHVSNQGHPHPSLLPAAPAGLGPLM